MPAAELERVCGQPHAAVLPYDHGAFVRAERAGMALIKQKANWPEQSSGWQPSWLALNLRDAAGEDCADVWTSQQSAAVGTRGAADHV